MSLSQKILGAALAFLLVVGLVSIPSTASDGLPLSLGEYAVYRFGECDPGTHLYSDVFDFAGRIMVRACPVELRWEVIGVDGGVADLRIAMSGWTTGRVEVQPWEGFPGPQHEAVKVAVVENLTAEHIVRVDRTTMDVTTQDGAYVGRWSFHLTPAEVAVERFDLARNWFMGIALPANVTVTKDLPSATEDCINENLGVDTFAWSRLDLGTPVPEGLEDYVYSTQSGWSTLQSSLPVYDADSLLLIYSFSRFYSDLLFSLYTMFWQDDLARPWTEDTACLPSSMTLADTNVFPIPGSKPPEDGGPGDGGPPPDDSGLGTGNAGPPWSTLLLFVALVVAVASLAYQRLRPRKRGDSSKEPPQSQPQGSEKRSPFGRK